MSVGSSDRAEEYPAPNLPFAERGSRFRAGFDYIRQMHQDAPTFANSYGSSSGGIDMLPKPTSGKLPLLITGGSQRDPDWFAQNGDGRMIYPRNPDGQLQVIRDWHERVEAAGRSAQSVMQPLYVNLAEDPDTLPQPIHLGFRPGATQLRDNLKSLEEIGVKHVALNLCFNRADIETTLKRLADKILPDFSAPGLSN